VNIIAFVSKLADGGTKPLNPNRWDPVSVDGKKTAARVTEHGYGLEGTNVWAKWIFEEGDGDAKVVKTLRAEGLVGGADRVLLIDGDGNETELADARTDAKITTQFPRVRTIIKCKYKDGDKDREYRFDGTNWP
jgi:hypothetical protein